MGLPKVSYPIFSINVPSLGKEIKFRSFLVKDEKVLLVAQNSKETKDIVLAIKQVINNCAIDDINVDELATFDLEYMFIKLRSKSVNNIIELKYVDPEDGEQYDISVDTDKIDVINLGLDEYKKVQISNTMGMVLKYPNASIVSHISPSDNETDMFFSILKHCISYIYDKDKTYNPGEYTVEEIEEFIADLDVKTLQKVQKFFESMPRIHYSTEYKTKSGKTKKLELNTLNDFFMLG
jgi:hypothetical protein